MDSPASSVDLAVGDEWWCDAATSDIIEYNN